MQTGLHRNTISKVYRQLETDGVVEAMAGRASMCEISRNRGSQNATASAIGASPTSTGKCAMRGQPANAGHLQQTRSS